MNFRFICWPLVTFVGVFGSSVMGQSLLELPVDADNCVIHRALSPETSEGCHNSNGSPRGIVLRIDDALDASKASISRGTVQPILQRPLSPAVHVASADTGGLVRNDASKSRISRAAAESKDGYFVQFAFDSSLLEPQFKAHLNRLSEVLKVQAMASSCIKIIGHTDTVGDRPYNRMLSKRRAETVSSYLKLKRGIPSKRISIEAAGETRPLPDIRGEDALNRRVEFATKESASGC